MPRHWHIQAYEAQAVVARSYALATIRPGRDFDLFSDTRSQVYGGIAAETRETNLAIGATAGHVLTYRGHVIAAYYHSTSGGRTSSSLDAWHTAKPYLVSVRDPFDAISPHHHWVEAVTAAELAAKLHVPGLRDVRAQTNASGRVVSLRAFGSGGSRPVTTDEFRSAFGLRSSFFELRVLLARRAEGRGGGDCRTREEKHRLIGARSIFSPSRNHERVDKAVCALEACGRRLRNRRNIEVEIRISSSEELRLRCVAEIHREVAVLERFL